MSITSKNSLPNIADHEQKALAVLNQQRFAISPAIQSNLGFDTLLLGLARPDSKALDHSVTAAQLAVALSDTDPVLNFNLAAALLAHRQLSQALLSYKKATNLVGRGQADLIGGAITDLHVVLRYCRGVNPEPYCRQLEAEAPKLKAALAAAAWPPGVGSKDSNISNLDLIAFPSGLGWSAQLHNVHLDRDVLAVICYARDGDWDVWRVLPRFQDRPIPRMCPRLPIASINSGRI